MAKPHQIHPVSEGRGKHIKMLVFGDPGAGKTRLAGTGDKTLILRPPTDHTDSVPVTADAEEWVVDDWKEMNDALEYLRHDGATQYRWVWLDGISLFQEYGLDHIWADTVARTPHRAQFGLDKGEYGRNMDRLSRWLRHVVGINTFNVGVTAHPFETETLDGDPLIMPYIQGKNMAPKICGYMNIVGYLRVKRDKNTKVVHRELLVAPLLRQQMTEIYAKDQLGALGGRMVDPTIPKIEAAVRAAQKGGTPSRRASKARPARVTHRRKP